MKTYLLYFFLFFSLNLFSKNSHSFYVDPINGNDANSGTQLQSPFKTIERARAAVRCINRTMENDICVYLRRGEYNLQTPVLFGSADGGCNGHKVIYTAYNRENVLISGGCRVAADWKLFDKKRNIYAVALPSNADSRQLFVNGLRAVRARSIGNEKFRITADTIGHITSNKDMLTWKNPANIECVYREIWTSPRCGVAKIEQLNDSAVRIVMKQPGWMNCRNKGITSARTPWYFENAYELLDEEGEWYLDQTGAVSGVAHTLFYKPRAWESMTKDEFVMPLAEKLFVVKGESAANPVRNLCFKGLNFSYTTWLRPNSDRGHSDAQNNVLRENKSGDGESMADGAALSLQYACKVEVSDCGFFRLGCAGVNMHAGCKDNLVHHSFFYDIAATAIQMGNYRDWKNAKSEDGYYPENSLNTLSGNRIINNHIENCGVEYRSATGIAAAFPVDMLVKRNTIINMPYSGMHIGWGWTTVPQTAMKNNRITNNFIQNVMLELADGGAIYTLGGNEKDQWSYIENNYVNRVMWGQCVYMDNGSSFYKIDNNVYKDGDDYNVKINSGSHDISATGIYSNKKKDLVGKTGCYNYHIDSTQLFSSKNSKQVQQIFKHAGSDYSRLGAWAKFPDINHYEAEHAQVSGGVFSTAGIGTHVFGYCGMGFLSGFDKSEEGNASFSFLVSKAKKCKIRLRYATDENWNGQTKLCVNSSKPEDVVLHATAKEQWATVEAVIQLRKGINEIGFVVKNPRKNRLLLDWLEILPLQ